MRLFEFVGSDPLRVKLVAITDQLKDRYLHANKPMSVDAFLQMMNDNDISVDISDLRDMISKEPLMLEFRRWHLSRRHLAGGGR
jgi:hypothetical protein